MKRGVIIFTIMALTLWVIAYFTVGIPRGEVTYNRGSNALWLEHEWAEAAKPIEEIRHLITRLAEAHITQVFLHVGPIEPDGTIPEMKYQSAKRFLEISRKFSNKINFHAWVGQWRSKLDIKNSAVIGNILHASQMLTGDTGFDGIHFDIEPVFDLDDHYLFLLKETRAALAKEKTISVAMPEILTPAAVKIAAYFSTPTRYVSQEYYRTVAAYADSMAVMAYESGITKNWLYRFFVQEQVVWATHAALDKKIFIGVPTFDSESTAENLTNAIIGIKKGLKNIRSKEEAFSGVAIYRYQTTDEEEWKIYKNLWLTNEP